MPERLMNLERWIAEKEAASHPTPWEQLILRARDALWEAEQILGDEEADTVAKSAAKRLADGQLRNGHMRAIKAHLRALSTGLGDAEVADYLADLTTRYGQP